MTQNDIAAVLEIATPLYAVIILLEIIASFIFEKHYYKAADTLTNTYLTLINFGLDLLMRACGIFVLGYFYQFHFFKIENPYIYWISLLLLEDFMFYWEHRIDHYCRLFWAVHVTHHSSDYYNITTGFRSSAFQPLYRFIYFIPLALAGFEYWDIMFMYAVTQIYGILIHTNFVGKLGFLEYFLATPSHHRVHHASNVMYLDKNMGMVLIIWDKLFGTFQVEDNSKEPIKFGLVSKMEHPYRPDEVIFSEWQKILKDLKRPVSFWIKLKYVFMPPGWSHDGSTKTSHELRQEYLSRLEK
jgi:sterol desaturase/sphingolipid hydroxylase (fatty acid hydroxylase superfamily)